MWRWWCWQRGTPCEGTLLSKAQRQHRVGCIQRFKSSFTRLGWFQTVLLVVSGFSSNVWGIEEGWEGNSWERRERRDWRTKPGEHFSLVWYKERVCKRQEEAEEPTRVHMKTRRAFQEEGMASGRWGRKVREAEGLELGSWIGDKETVGEVSSAVWREREARLPGFLKWLWSEELEAVSVPVFWEFQW